MINRLKLMHLTIPLLMTFAFLYLQMELIDNLIILITNLLIFIICFINYGVTCYLIFHISPGYEDYRYKTEQLGINQLFQYKNNEERRHILIQELQKKSISEQQHKILAEQLITLYTKNSFCDICRFIKTPRSHHCRKCDKCVLRMQYHCKFLQTCIGQKNHKIYIQYLMSGMYFTFCIGLSCLVCIFKYQHNLEVWSGLKRYIYAFLCASNIVLFFGFLYLFTESMINIKRNITCIEKKISSLKQKNPFTYEDYYHKLFPRFLDYFDLVYRSEVFEMELVDDHSMAF